MTDINSIDFSLINIQGGGAVGNAAAFDSIDNIIAFTCGSGIIVYEIHTAETDEDEKNTFKLDFKRFFCCQALSNTLQSGPCSTTPEFISFDDLGFPKLEFPLDFIMDVDKKVIQGLSSSQNKSFTKVNSATSPFGYSIPTSPSLRNISSVSSSSSMQRTISCISLSPVGDLLAVGETGYQPRILIFSLASISSEVPIATIQAHSFGIKLLKFSDDGKFLVSTGSNNDGFIYVWKINRYPLGRSLHNSVDSFSNKIPFNTKNVLSFFNVECHSSNKCSSVINQIIWYNDLTIVTIGKRFIKAWKLDLLECDDKNGLFSACSTSHKTIPGNSAYDCTIICNNSNKLMSGRNILLKDLLDETIVACEKYKLKCTNNTSLETSGMLLLTESGSFCKIENNNDIAHGSELIPLKKVAQSKIRCFIIDKNMENIIYFYFADTKKEPVLVTLSLNEILSADFQYVKDSNSSIESSLGTQLSTFRAENKISHIYRIDRLQNNLIFKLDDTLTLYDVTSKQVRPIIDNIISDISGVFEFRKFMYFWSSSGKIYSYDALNGRYFQLLDLQSFYFSQNTGFDNELRSFCVFNYSNDSQNNSHAFGDKLGILSIIEYSSNPEINVKFQERIHDSAINSIAHIDSKNWNILITVSRDRTIQLLGKNKMIDGYCSWQSMNTIKSHTSSISRVVAFGDYFFTASSDRTISVFKVLQCNDPKIFPNVELQRTINLGSTPVNILAFNDKLFAITTDRKIRIYRISQNFRLIHSISPGSQFSKVSFSIDNLVYIENLRLLVCSCSDKCIRILKYLTGEVIYRFSGLSKFSRGLFFVPPSTIDQSESGDFKILSFSSDGSIFTWNISSRNKVDSILPVIGKQCSSPTGKSYNSRDVKTNLEKLINAKPVRKYAKSFAASNKEKDFDDDLGPIVLKGELSTPDANGLDKRENPQNFSQKKSSNKNQNSERKFENSKKSDLNMENDLMNSKIETILQELSSIKDSINRLSNDLNKNMIKQVDYYSNEKSYMCVESTNKNFDTRLKENYSMVQNIENMSENLNIENH